MFNTKTRSPRSVTTYGGFLLSEIMNDEKKQLEQERNELNTLINKGVTFEVKDTEFEVEKRFFGLIKRYKPKEVTRTFRIEEMTLATLDRVTSELVEIAIDENEMKSADTDSMKMARTLAHKHSLRCARIIAIAVLGEDRLVAKPGKGGIRWIEDTKKLDELTSLFARKIKPSILYKLYVLVNTMGNLGDFMNSIRLISTERTTMPIRIEENNEG